ncbi:7662_t:CDS:1, partial [Dentiscutata erythropus]
EKNVHRYSMTLLQNPSGSVTSDIHLVILTLQNRFQSQWLSSGHEHGSKCFVGC